MFNPMTRTLLRSLTVLAFTIPMLACDGFVDEAETLEKSKQYVQEKKLNAAIIELKNLLKANASHAEARFMLARLSMILGDLQTAEKEVRRARDAGWDEAQSELLNAVILTRLGEREKVLDEVQVRDSYPASIRANLMGLMASAEMALGNIAAARDTLALGEQIDPEANWILQSKIRLLVREQKHDDALALSRKAAELFPQEQDFWLINASMEERAGNKDQLVAAMKKVLEAEPGRIMTIRGRQASLGLVQHYIAEADYDAAKGSLAPVLKNYSKDPAANYYAAVLDYLDKDYEAAIEHLSRVMAAVPEHRDSLTLMGRIYYSDGDYEQAALYLERATRAEPDNVSAQAILGQTYMALGQYADAEERLSIVSSSVKDNPKVAALIGVSQIRSGERDAGIQQLERVLEQAPGNVGVRQELARAYILSGDADAAIESLKDIKGDVSELANYRSKALMVMANLRAGKIAEARKITDQLKQELPQEALAYNLSGYVSESENDYDTARKEFETGLGKKSDSLLSLLSLSRIDMIEGKFKAADDRLNDVLKLSSDNTAALIGKARIAMNRAQIESALDWLQKARKSNPEDIESRALLANYHISQNRAGDSLEYVSELRAINSKDPRVLTIRAAAMVDTGNREAPQAIQELMDYDPGLPYAHYYEAKYRLMQKDIEGSRKSLTRALEIKPDYLEALVAMGNIERTTGDPKASLKRAQAAQEAYPGNGSGYVLAARAHLKLDDVSAAIATLEKGVKLVAESDVVIMLNKIHMGEGNTEKGITELKSWLDRHPQDLPSRFNLAVSYMALKDYDNAITQYEKILEVKPNVPAVMNDLAWLYDQTGRSGGLEMARRAHQLVPDNPAIQDTYGWLLVKSGRIANALATLEDAARKAPQSRDIQYHYAYTLNEDKQFKKARSILDKILADDQPFHERSNAEKLAATMK